MSTRDTSIYTYYQEVLPFLGTKQKAVLRALFEEENMTNTELADYMGWPINTITPRIKELRDRGLVKEVGKRICKVTGRTVYAWKASKAEEPVNSVLF